MRRRPAPLRLWLCGVSSRFANGSQQRTPRSPPTPPTSATTTSMVGPSRWSRRWDFDPWPSQPPALATAGPPRVASPLKSGDSSLGAHSSPGRTSHPSASVLSATASPSCARVLICTVAHRMRCPQCWLCRAPQGVPHSDARLARSAAPCVSDTRQWTEEVQALMSNQRRGLCAAQLQYFSGFGCIAYSVHCVYVGFRVAIVRQVVSRLQRTGSPLAVQYQCSSD